MPDPSDEFRRLFGGLPDCKFHFTFHGIEAANAKAEVLMEAAIKQMREVERALLEPWDEPFPAHQRRAACLRLCAETFDRLEQQRKTA